MVRATLTTCLLGVFVLAGSGCMTCCPPMMPMENPFYGCVETGPLGNPRPSHADKREMRRALRRSFAGNQCPTCQSGFDAGYGEIMGSPIEMLPDAYGMHDSGTCPTCQQHLPMSAPMYGAPMMESAPGTEMQPHQITVPTPMPTPAPMSPTPSVPSPSPMPGSPTPMAAPNSTSQFYPTGASPLFNTPTAAMPGVGHQYSISRGQVSQRPPQIQPFNTPTHVHPVSAAVYSPAPSPGPMQMQPSGFMESVPMEQFSPQSQAAQTSAEMVYIPSQRPVSPSSLTPSSPVQRTLYAP